MIAISILATIAIITLYFISIIKINKYSVENYGTRIVSIRNFIMMLPSILAALGAFVFYKHPEVLNFWVMVLATVAWSAYVINTMSKRTSFFIAAYAYFAMTILWAIIIIILFLIITRNSNTNRGQEK